MQLIKLLILTVVSATILSSCACPIPATPVLNRPATPVYPVIKAEELTCLTDETYKKLNLRRVMCEKRVTTLEGIIDSTKKD